MKLDALKHQGKRHDPTSGQIGRSWIREKQRILLQKMQVKALGKFSALSA